jgi:hypothetical protein
MVFADREYRALQDGYYNLRRTSSIVRDADHRFEGKRWEKADHMIVRKAEGWELRVYEIEGEIEACLINPTGESRTYC